MNMPASPYEHPVKPGAEKSADLWVVVLDPRDPKVVHDNVRAMRLRGFELVAAFGWQDSFVRGSCPGATLIATRRVAAKAEEESIRW